MLKGLVPQWKIRWKEVGQANIDPELKLNRSKTELLEVLEGSLGSLGQSWRILDASGMRSGCVLERQGPSWRRLEAILGRLGSVLEASWGVLEAFWQHFGGICEHFSRIFQHWGKYAKTAENLRKPMVFHGFLWF